MSSQYDCLIAIILGLCTPAKIAIVNKLLKSECIYNIAKLFKEAGEEKGDSGTGGRNWIEQ